MVLAAQRDRLLARIAELEVALRAARSYDLRATIREAIADCERAGAALGQSAPRAAQVAAQPG